MINPDINIITGYSGSGKSTALKAFEDAGYYCVDNMPVILLPKFLELPLNKMTDISGFAFVMDLREKDFLSDSAFVFSELKKKGYHFRIIFLMAKQDILVRRFSQTRRTHPLTKGSDLIEGITKESVLLKSLKKKSDIIVDSSTYTVHQLKSEISSLILKENKTDTMKVSILSFGFKNGLPKNTDLVVDVRFLSNPYFVPELKYLDGENSKVSNFIMKDPNTSIFLNKYIEMLDFLLPLYKKEGKAYLTIAIGCTGGHHRSVAISRAIYEHIKTKKTFKVSLNHRDLDR